jgi:ferredoxin
VCPVDCIHPRKDEPEFAQTTMLYIHPEECIDCGACVPACPVAAIYESIDATPSHQKDLVEANAIYRNGDSDSVAKAEAIVKAHITAQATLMAIPATERQAAHASH